MSEPPKDNNSGSNDVPIGRQPAPPINAEMAQYLSQKCAQEGESIAQTVLRDVYPAPHVGSFQQQLTPSLSIIAIHNEKEPQIHLTGTTDRIRGVGDSLWGNHFINFHYDQGALQQDLRESFGVDTPLMLGVSLHTDAATRERVIEALERKEISTEFMYTYYYFDAQGNFAKTIQLPVDWEDDRPEVSRDQWYKTLRVVLTPQDFELAGGALEFIKDELLKHVAFKKNPNDQDQDSNN